MARYIDVHFGRPQTVDEGIRKELVIAVWSDEGERLTVQTSLLLDFAATDANVRMAAAAQVRAALAAHGIAVGAGDRVKVTGL